MRSAAFWASFLMSVFGLIAGIAIPKLGLNVPAWTAKGALAIAFLLLVPAFYFYRFNPTRRGGEGGKAASKGIESAAKGGRGGDAGLGIGGKGGDASVVGYKSSAKGGRGGNG